jgi:hypothetical protein
MYPWNLLPSFLNCCYHWLFELCLTISLIFFKSSYILLWFVFAREPSINQSNHKTQVIWKGRGDLLCYSPTFPLLCASRGCWRCLLPLRRSSAYGPADASEGGIHAAENCVARGNWTQDLGSDTMRVDESWGRMRWLYCSTGGTIYRGEGPP